MSYYGMRGTEYVGTNFANRRKGNNMPPHTNGSNEVVNITSELAQIKLEIDSLKEKRDKWMSLVQNVNSLSSEKNELKKEIDELKKEVVDLKRVKQEVADEINILKAHKTETMQILHNMEFRFDAYQSVINERIEPLEKTMNHEYQKYLILCPVIQSLKATALQAIESDNWDYCFDLLDKNLLRNSQAKEQLRDITAGDNILEQAARKGYTELVAVFIKNGFPLDSPCGEDGGTLLHFAVIEEKIALAEFLLSQGAFVDSKDKYGYTPLYWTVGGNRNSRIIEELISRGANINTFSRSTPLHNACRNGNYDAVRILLDNKAYINIQTSEERRTPLHDAAVYGDVRIVRLLLERGAFVDKRTKYCQTPLHLAAEKGKFSVLKTLVNYNCNIYAKNCHGRTALDLAEENYHYPIVSFLCSKMW